MDSFEKIKELLPLHCAVLLRDIGAVKELIAEGLSVGPRCNNLSPLVLSVIPVNSRGIYESFKYRVEDSSKNEPLKEIVQTLVEHGADLTDVDQHGQTVLHWAVKHNPCLDIIRYLVDKGADINARDNSLRTPLHLLCTSRKELRPTSYEIAYLDHEQWDAFFDQNKKASAAFLLEKGADPYALDNKAYSPVARLVCSWEQDTEWLLQIVLDKGVSLIDHTHISDNGNSLLHRLFMASSVIHGQVNPEILKSKIKLLVKYGIDVNLPNAFGMTPLHYACLYYVKCYSVKTLCSLGANAQKQDSLGRNPLHYLHLSQHYGTECYTLTKFLVEIAQILIDEGDLVNIQDRFGCSPLHYAVIRPQLAKYVQFLVKSGAKLEAQDMHGATPLHYCVAYGNVKTLKALVQGSSDRCWDVKDVFGSSILHYAVLNNSPDAVEVLLQAGVHSQEEDNEGYMPLDRAKQCGYINLVPLLDESLVKSGETTTKSKRDTNIIDIPYSSQVNPVALDTALSCNLQQVHVPDDLAAFGEGIIASPVIGAWTNNAESAAVLDEVVSFIQHIARLCASEDPMLKFTPVLRGSAREGTKSGAPDEFDFMLEMTELEGKFAVVEEHDENKWGFASLFCKSEALNADVFKKHPYLLTSSGNLHGSRTAYILCQMLRDVLREDTAWKDTKLSCVQNIELSIVAIKLTLLWTGCFYKQLNVSIDLVPCISIHDFQPSYMRSNLPIPMDTSQVSLHILFANSIEDDGTLEILTCEISYTSLETALMSKLPCSMKQGYMLAKALRTRYVCPALLDNNQGDDIFTIEWNRNPKCSVRDVLEGEFSEEADKGSSDGDSSQDIKEKNGETDETKSLLSDTSEYLRNMFAIENAEDSIRSYFLKTALFHVASKTEFETNSPSTDIGDVIHWTRAIYQYLFDAMQAKALLSYFDDHNLLLQSRQGTDGVNQYVRDSFDCWKSEAMKECSSHLCLKYSGIWSSHLSYSKAQQWLDAKQEVKLEDEAKHSESQKNNADEDFTGSKHNEADGNLRESVHSEANDFLTNSAHIRTDIEVIKPEHSDADRDLNKSENSEADEFKKSKINEDIILFNHTEILAYLNIIRHILQISSNKL